MEEYKSAPTGRTSPSYADRAAQYTGDGFREAHARHSIGCSKSAAANCCNNVGIHLTSVFRSAANDCLGLIVLKKSVVKPELDAGHVFYDLVLRPSLAYLG